jgi:hypothetical protein
MFWKKNKNRVDTYFVETSFPARRCSIYIAGESESNGVSFRFECKTHIDKYAVRTVHSIGHKSGRVCAYYYINAARRCSNIFLAH